MKINIENVLKLYDGKEVLREINFLKDDIKVLALIGASGSGKSTLLRLIAGLEAFQGGEICVNEHNVSSNDPEYRKNIGFVFQDHNLFNHLTVLENIYLVLEKVHKKKIADVEGMVKDLLLQFDLYEHKDKLPHQLSGGQSQRVSIVRALSISPELILLDEPTSSLDPILTYEVLLGIRQLLDADKEFVIVTHEIGFAKNIADYIIFMDDGMIIEHGTNEMLENPQTEQLKGFLEKVLTFEN